MPIPSNPPFLPGIIGQAADVLPILDATPTGSGALSYQAGWPAITSIALEAGGIAPQREYFNAVNRLLSEHVHFLQSGGVYKWDAALDYLPGAHILGSDGVEYISQALNGPNVPNVGARNPVLDNGAYWKTVARAQGGGGVPKGFIGPFSGSFGGSDGRRPIPRGDTVGDENWVLCDGGGDGLGGVVPDLRDRFILGAGPAWPAGSIAGSANHSHNFSGTVGYTTLDGNTLPSHGHDCLGHGYRNTSSGSERNIMIDAPGGADTWGVGIQNSGASWGHTHSMSASSDAESNMPPFYALAYIIRVS